MSLRKLKLLVAILFLAFGIAQASAATKELTRSIFSVIPWEEDFPDFEMRFRFAEAIQAYWSNFDKQIPRLSPQELEWIQAELKSEGGRLTRAINSTEYAIWSLNEHTDHCLEAVNSVLDSMNSEETRQFEMFFWLKMVNCYDGSNDILIYLDRAGISYNDEAGVQLQTPISNITQQIIVNKVAPMAMAETMNWKLSN